MAKSFLRRYVFIGVLISFSIFTLLIIHISNDGPGLSTSWYFSDLRVFDPLDSQFAKSDLIAAYTRRMKGFIEFRFDVLDLQAEDHSVIQLSATNKLGQTVWIFRWSDKTIPLLAYSNEIFPKPLIIPTVISDPLMDYFVIRLNSDLMTLFRESLSFRIQLLDADTGKVLDEITSFSEKDHEHRTSSILLEFWNTLPSATPSQLLRSWDGAHSGPFGQRHGLKYLIDNAEEYRIPLVLLDLKSTYPLLALDMLSARERVKDLEKRSMLLLPISFFVDQINPSMDLNSSKDIAKIYNLSTKNLIVSHISSQNPFVSKLFFSQLIENTHIYQVGNNRYIPLPITFPLRSDSLPTPFDIARSVFSENVKKDIFEIALSQDRRKILILGDDLRYSSWADGQLSPLLFRYIKEHPWIKVLDGDDLWNYSAISTKKGDLPVQCEGVLICNGLDPAGSFSSYDDSPLGLFVMELINQVDNYYMQENIRRDSNLLGNLSYLQFAEEWFSNPQNRLACEVDFGDGLPSGCVIASENSFVLIDPTDGDIILAIARISNQLVIMNIPPSPMMFKNSHSPVNSTMITPEKDDYSNSSFSGYDYEFFTNGILFHSRIGESFKRYFLDSSSLHIEINSEAATNMTFTNLALSDVMKYAEVSSNALPWREIRDIQPIIQFTDGETKRISFTDSHEFLQKGEFPNFDYPAGHYLPVPYQHLEISGFHRLNMEFVYMDE